MSVATSLTNALLVIAAIMGASYVIFRTPTIKWKDILVAAGFAVVPALIITGIIGGVSATALAVVLGIVAGHSITLLDDD